MDVVEQAEVEGKALREQLSASAADNSLEYFDSIFRTPVQPSHRGTPKKLITLSALGKAIHH